MAYSKNPSKPQFIMPQLQPLIEGKSCRWVTAAGEAEAWCYKVREALHIASTYPLQYPELSRAHASVEVEVLGPTIVQARWIDEREEMPNDIDGADLDEVLARLYSLGHLGKPLHFPNHRLSLTELYSIAATCDTLEPRWMALSIRNTGALTLAPYDAELEAVRIRAEDFTSNGKTDVGHVDA